MTGTRAAWAADQLARKARAEAGECVVANMHSPRRGAPRVDEALLAWAEETGRFVRIGRGTLWGNPFKMPDDGPRPVVVAKFANFYLPHKPRLLALLPTLRGKVLGCWCHPEQCHGHIIAARVNAMPTDDGSDELDIVRQLAVALAHSKAAARKLLAPGLRSGEIGKADADELLRRAGLHLQWLRWVANQSADMPDPVGFAKARGGAAVEEMADVMEVAAIDAARAAR